MEKQNFNKEDLIREIEFWKSQFYKLVDIMLESSKVRKDIFNHIKENFK